MGSVAPRYALARLGAALDACRSELAKRGQAAPGELWELFMRSYERKLTSVIALTGAAMAPALNAEALHNKSAFEKLVVRLIPRPTPRTVAVGDVVAFNSPLGPPNPHSIMVRRVAALEGHPMLSSDDADALDRVPQQHCWVLADNEELSPPEVIDSRSFGYLDMSLILGRVVYKVANAKQHGPVANSPQSEAADAAVIASEVDPDALAAGMPGSEEQQPQPQPPQQRQAEQQQQQEQEQ